MHVPNDSLSIVHSLQYWCSFVSCIYAYMSWDNTLCKLTRPQMEDRVIWVRFPAGETILFLIHSVQTGPEAFPAFYPVDAGDPFDGHLTAGE
jgi:hypothetical protein